MVVENVVLVKEMILRKFYVLDFVRGRMDFYTNL